jgi:hypothetical protein
MSMVSVTFPFFLFATKRLWRTVLQSDAPLARHSPIVFLQAQLFNNEAYQKSRIPEIVGGNTMLQSLLRRMVSYVENDSCRNAQKKRPSGRYQCFLRKGAGAYRRKRPRYCPDMAQAFSRVPQG